MKTFLRNFLHYLLSSQRSFFVIPVWDPENLTLHQVIKTGHALPKTWCTRILLTLLLILFPLLASSISIEDIEENCDYEYYPKLDSSSADELHVIKRNYYRYGKELKILADERIKEITLGTSDVTRLHSVIFSKTRSFI
ncbi:uncharacterized protein TNIN_56551 [Trichonephila inaurata madagascariensis]|uniref:Uncharacterized protein n=1 Tax=Trichonephila inaurata madagascariensis TaxID=2747483 RepID=A0A8X6YVC8_9ARAC|nr:uncharacterized protein TNIN_38891 [Trichonephila inaurata madagascariensis]GFY80005.1 uncharacterized protein TNIN_56551 [Trichonephila inaurata madagascariensis]